MKIHIDETELWPFYCEDTNPVPFGKTIDLSDDDVADLRRVMSEFHAWQKRLYALMVSEK